MPIAFFQSWRVLLAVPLTAFGLGASVVPLTPAIAHDLQGHTSTHASTTVALTATKPGVLAQRSRIQRVRFTPGANSATIKSSVVNGTRDRYLLGAQKGQTLSLRLVSLDGNAVFDVVAPVNSAGQQPTLKQEAVVWSTTLPETGDYQIVVGSTRGNASYRLQVTIK